MEKKIEEMANDIAQMCPNLAEDCCGDINCATCLAKGLVKQGYRKIYDDNSKQCVCYALGCQEGEKIKQTTAKEIIDLADELIQTIESEQSYTGFTVEVVKSVIRFFQTKIMERYGR